VNLQAFLSRRMVMPQGIRPTSVLVDGGRIRAVADIEEIPSDILVQDFGELAKHSPRFRGPGK
jgi:hypothetical protein